MCSPNKRKERRIEHKSDPGFGNAQPTTSAWARPPRSWGSISRVERELRQSRVTQELPQSKWRVLLPVVLMTVLAVGVLAALYSVAPRERLITALEAQPLAVPSLATIDDSAWQPYRLLRRMRTLKGGDTEYAVVRFRIPDEVLRRQSIGIFIPTYDSSIAAYLNGQFLGEAGSVTAPIAVNGYHPALFRIRTEQLRPAGNVVDLLVAQSIPGIGIIHAVYVGPIAKLERAWSWISFASVDILRVYNGLFLVLGGFALFVYWQLRRERVFLWFALLIGFCGTRNLDLLWTQWPESQRMRALMIFGSSLGILLACSGFVNRLVDRRAPFDRWLLLAMPPLMLLFWWRSGVDLMNAYDEGYAVLRIVFALVAPLMLWRLWHAARSLPSWRAGWMLGCLCMATTFVAHDVVTMWVVGALNYQYSLLASLPMVSAFVVGVGHRYVQSANALEASHATLERRVKETERALKTSHELLRQLEREQALSEERQRIMRDMHDGVGGQLSSLVMTLRRRERASVEVAQIVEQSLNDLRLIIDSLDDVLSADLRTALGMFRHRITPWLEQNGMMVEWHAELPPIGGYGPRETLQLFRIMHEACSNIVKHSGANLVTISARGDTAQGNLVIEIADNGRGGVSSEPNNIDGLNLRRGIANMTQRARELKGTLQIDSTSSGTRIRVVLPSPPIGGESHNRKETKAAAL
jgi:signal transduction histidine kinase